MPFSIGRVDLVALAAVGVAAISLWAFLEIADRVTEGGPGHLDIQTLQSLREPSDPADPIGPRWVEQSARDITALGGYTVLTLLVASVVGYLVMARHFSAALLILASTLGGLLLSHLLKDYYRRPRPDLVPHLVQVSTDSFPSGHAMMSAAVYMTLGALLARFVQGWWTRLYFITVSAFVTLLVGMSRVYLGVHYSTDVAAGWAAGLGWAVTCWIVARYLQRRGVVETDVG